MTAKLTIEQTSAMVGEFTRVETAIAEALAGNDDLGMTAETFSTAAEKITAVLAGAGSHGFRQAVQKRAASQHGEVVGDIYAYVDDPEDGMSGYPAWLVEQGDEYLVYIPYTNRVYWIDDTDDVDIDGITDVLHDCRGSTRVLDEEDVEALDI